MATTTPKRLFIFAGFDRDGIVDDTLIYYVNELSKLGDVFFVMDNDLPDTELNKISKIPNVLCTIATRHGEYDFGSYKRGYVWSRDKHILKKYDWIYFVNDSVYGPLYDLTPTLQSLENSGSDLVGMIAACDNNTPWHVQSWFVGFSPKVFNADFFDEFVGNITCVKNKTALIMKYEIGLSCAVMRHGFDASVLIDAPDNNLYDNPRVMLVRGLPFVKKNGISNLRKMYFLYPHVSNDKLLDYIDAHMRRHNVKMVKDSFRDTYNLRFFGLPILRISSKRSKYFKVYLFKYIPILKIVK